MSLTFIEITKKEEQFLKEMVFEALYVRVDQPPFEYSILEEPSIKKYYSNWNSSNDLGIILLLNGQRIGAGWHRLFTKENSGYGFVDEQTPELIIALRKQFHNQGLGTKLLLELFKKSKIAGFHQLSLSVDQESPALRLYQRLGFEIHEAEGTAFTMIKKLSM
jgi:ribosomal protein S18 acetylase RimI-like enzyme